MIEAEGLTKRYGSVTALQDASFRVEAGEVLGMLGPNGAGKTTTMKILTTYLIPSEGTARVAGHDIHEDPLAVRTSVGYLPEHSPLYGDMEVREYLRFMGRARGLEGAALRERIDWVVERCAIQEIYRSPVPTISFGYRQRVCLAQALIHDPPVLILDEPTTGLDPLQILGIRELIRDLATEKAIVFSTHILQEAAAISDRILVIHKGRVVADDRLEELQKRAAGGYRTRFAVEGTATKEVRDALSDIEGVREVQETEGPELLVVSSRSVAEDLYDLARGRNWRVRLLAEDPPGLEETFISLTHPDAEPASVPLTGEAEAAGEGDGAGTEEVSS